MLQFQERDTACCLREDQAGCVQTQKSECKGGFYDQDDDGDDNDIDGNDVFDNDDGYDDDDYYCCYHDYDDDVEDDDMIDYDFDNIIQ